MKVLTRDSEEHKSFSEQLACQDGRKVVERCWYKWYRIEVAKRNRRKFTVGDPLAVTVEGALIHYPRVTTRT